MLGERGSGSLAIPDYRIVRQDRTTARDAHLPR
jgi:hypothetical protein